MWQNIWTFFKALLNYDDRLTRVEKQNERLTQKQNELTTELTALYLEMGRMVEREKWREEKLQQAIEIKRLQQVHESAKLENERLRFELERERRQLPPATIKPPDDTSQP